MRSKTFKHSACFLATAALPYLFGLAQISWFEGQKGEKTLNLVLVQTDMLPSEKMLLAERSHEFISPFAQWEGILKCLKEMPTGKKDLIVLPEAAVSMPSDLCHYRYSDVRGILTKTFGREAEKKFPPLVFPFAEQYEDGSQKIWGVSNLFWCQALANIYDSELVSGLDHADRETKKNFNSAFYFQPYGAATERYDKQILLPLAEYLPGNFFGRCPKFMGSMIFILRAKRIKFLEKKFPLAPPFVMMKHFLN